jgi:hypothetical protein
VPVNLAADTVSTNPEDQSLSSDIVIHFGSIKLELHNNASAALIENTLRALQNVR